MIKCERVLITYLEGHTSLLHHVITNDSIFARTYFLQELNLETINTSWATKIRFRKGKAKANTHLSPL